MTKIRFGEKMTILGNNPFLEQETEEENNSKRFTHALYKKEPDEIPLKTCVFISAMLHPVTIGVIWLIIFILALLGVNFALFHKPEPKPKDIEFVLVQNTAEPINKNTKYRADRNSRAGGIHDPKRPVSLPVSSPSPAPKAASSTPDKPAQKKRVQQRTQPQKTVQTPKKQQQKPAQKAPTPSKKQVTMPWEAPKIEKPVPKPQPQKQQGTTQSTVTQPAPRPALKPAAPKTVQKPKGSFNMPVPKTTAPKVTGPTGGPVTGSPSGGRASGTAGGGRFSPSPSFSPAGSGSSAGAKRSGTGRGGAGGGSIGNPGPGNPKGAPGIDALKEPDFGPYMRELQRRIKMNWDPPKGNESKRVVLMFKIARDGRLLSNRVIKSSGLPAADSAAKHAVELTAPFKPLPPEYRGDSVDIQFTFDYNVFGASMY